MKAKRIALVYVNGFVENVASIEKAFNNIVNELVEEGRIILSSTTFSTRFEDGTVVYKVMLGGQMLGNRLTHLYIDEKILELASGKKYINETLKPLVIREGAYEHFDAEGSPADRIMTFGINGFNKLKGE